MRRLLVLLALAVSATLVLAPPADAGGPTSVLIADPTTERAAGLYYSDAAYRDLNRILADGERLSTRPSGLGPRSVNLIWMIRDVTPWQAQQLYLDAAGGPVVATYGIEATGNAGDVVWTRPTEGRALQRLVQGVLAGSSSIAAPAAAPAAPAPDPVATERVVTETAWYSLAGWRWLAPGVLLGAGVGLLATRSRRRDHEPRQVLVDVAP
ncbi:hypothetical protein GCM10027062_21290 [Nocardioides hungaricus]